MAMEAGSWWWSGRGDVTVEGGGVGRTPVFEVAVEGGGSGGGVAVEGGGGGGGGRWL